MKQEFTEANEVNEDGILKLAGPLRQPMEEAFTEANEGNEGEIIKSFVSFVAFCKTWSCIRCSKRLTS